MTIVGYRKDVGLKKNFKQEKLPDSELLRILFIVDAFSILPWL